jgi:hypothetical protein
VSRDLRRDKSAVLWKPLNECNLVKAILVISCIPVFVAAIYAAIIYSHLGKTLKRFSFFLFLSAAMQLASGIAWWCGMNNMPLLHLYVAVGFVCIALFYREVFKDVLHPQVMLLVCAAFILFALYNIFPIEMVFRFNSKVLTAQSVLVIIFALSTFLLLLNEQSKEVLIPERKILNWINSGFFIYYSSSLLIFYFSDVMARVLPVYLNQNTWILHSFFSIIMYSCFIIALWKRPKSLIF